MRKKLTIEFVREQFEKEGYTLLTKEYVNSKTPLEYICPEGDKGKIVWSNWQKGRRCFECHGNKKLTIDFVREEFEKEGYILLSTEYKGNKHPLEYICPKLHKDKISWSNWNYGRRCAECAGKKKYTIKFIQDIFEQEGYILLTKKYGNCEQILKYICPKLHKGGISWSNWRHGHRCAECYYEKIKGKNHHNYNPALTKEDRINGRRIPGYVEWGYGVKERDNFTCQVCGQLRGNIVSHHLESYSSNLCLRTILENGVCLCEKCYKEFHFMYGYKNNTKKQFEEFMGAGV
jgi:hypothetical protein